MTGAPPASEDGAGATSPWFGAVVFVGGLLFGVGLAVSRMVRPEVVLSFLRGSDLGLVLVMGGASLVVGLAVLVGTTRLDRAPLTGRAYGRRLRELDRSVVAGGAVFGVGWGLSGLCPGAAYAGLGAGDLPLAWGVLGMFAGAYLQGVWRSRSGAADASVSTAD